WKYMFIVAEAGFPTVCCAGRGEGKEGGYVAKVKCAIIGSGNIGTDLMIKIQRGAAHLQVAALVGIDPDSDGLARAARLGIAAISTGIEGLRAHPEYAQIRVVFDATSAGAHVEHARLLAADGKKVIDLTPAALGPFTIPVIA